MRKEIAVVFLFIIIAAFAFWFLWKPGEVVKTAPRCPSACAHGCVENTTECINPSPTSCPSTCLRGCVYGTLECIKPHEPMQIGQCGSVTETSELVGNINSEHTCLSMEGDNVILDCRGHSITGVQRQDAYAIYVTGKNDTIENCITENFGSGIFVDSSSDLYIHDVTVGGNLQYGILVKSSKNISLERVAAVGNNQAGIRLLSSSEISLSDNKISGAEVGILVESSNVAKLSSNNICDYVSTAVRCNDTQISSAGDNVCKISVGCNITCLPCEQISNQ